MKRFLYFTKWSEDKWTSIIAPKFFGITFYHPDKLGHLIAHGLITWLWLWFTGGSDIALLVDLWINTQVEVMDGTRPRRELTAWAFESQDQYEQLTIEGFSVKDWIAGILGSLLSYLAWRIFA